MDTWWSPAATRREARLSRHPDPPFVVSGLPARGRLQWVFHEVSALEAVAAGAVLAALASDLRPAGCTASTKHSILDGTLLPIDRIAAD